MAQTAPIKLSPRQAAVVVTVLQALPRFEPKVKLLEFPTIDGHPIVAATRVRDSDESIFAVFTLGEHDRQHILITITDGDLTEVGGVLAEVASASFSFEIGKSITLGHNDYFAANGRVGAVLASTSGSNALATLPDEVDVKGRKMSVYFVIFLDEPELRLVRERGPEALGEYFDECDRNYAAIRAARRDA